MPFRTTEYDDEFAHFVIEAARELAVSREPLLAEISFEKSKGALGSVIQGKDRSDVDLPPSSAEVAGTSSIDAIRDGKLVDLILSIDDMSAQMADSYMKSLLGTADTVTEATGNVFDASGRPNFEVFIEALEAREWSLTEDDKLAMPSLVMNPADVDKLPGTGGAASH